MPPIRLRLGAVAVWLGVVALGLNALVPIHLAFDLAHSLTPGHRDDDSAAGHDFVRCLLTLLTGHHHEDESRSSSGNGHHHSDCAVSSAIGTLAGFAPAGVTPLAVPPHSYVLTPLAADSGAPHRAPLAAYRSRAPPPA
jgi:hypothetical protein